MRRRALFIEELCHSISAGNPSDSLQGRAAHGWVATLVASRLARLPPEQVNVVRAAAVIATRCRTGCWCRLAAARRIRPRCGAGDAIFFMLRRRPWASLQTWHHQGCGVRVHWPARAPGIAPACRNYAAGAFRTDDREDTLEALAYHSRVRAIGRMRLIMPNAPAIRPWPRSHWIVRSRNIRSPWKRWTCAESFARAVVALVSTGQQTGHGQHIRSPVAQRRCHVYERAVALAGSLAMRACWHARILARLYVLRLRTISGGRDACATCIGRRP